MSPSPPLRFLVLLLAGWAGIRAAWLAPGWWSPPAGAGGSAPVGGSGTEALAPARSKVRAAVPAARTSVPPGPAKRRNRLSRLPPDLPGATAAGEPAAQPPWQILSWQLPPSAPAARRALPTARPAGPTDRANPSRWSLSAWSFLRAGEGSALAPGGTLGGSQIGVRAGFRLNADPSRPLALSLRLAAPVRRPAAGEVALGIDWRPSRRVPVHVLAERRQGLGREGRSAFGLTVHGGVSDEPLGGLRIDAYAQAGIVGTRSRDLFGDGALRLSVPLGRLRLGAAAWAAAQPGIARLDLGPAASLRLPIAGRSVALGADWRQRVAGDAGPGSGPALTLATDF